MSSSTEKRLWLSEGAYELQGVDASGEVVVSTTVEHDDLAPRAFRHDHLLLQAGDDVRIVRVDDALQIEASNDFQLPSSLSGYRGFAIDRAFTSGLFGLADDDMISVWEDPNTHAFAILPLIGGLVPDPSNLITPTTCAATTGGESIDFLLAPDGLFRHLVRMPGGTTRSTKYAWAVGIGTLGCANPASYVDYDLSAWGLSPSFQATGLHSADASLHVVYSRSGQALDFTLDTSDQLVAYTSHYHASGNTLWISGRTQLDSVFHQTSGGTDVHLEVSNRSMTCSSNDLTRCDDWRLEADVPAASLTPGAVDWVAADLTFVDQCGEDHTAGAGPHPVIATTSSFSTIAKVNTQFYDGVTWRGTVIIDEPHTSGKVAFDASVCSSSVGDPPYKDRDG